MTKQRKSDEARPLAEIKMAANAWLIQIAGYEADIEVLEAEAKSALQALDAEYGARIVPLKAELKLYVSSLVATMKSNKAMLFDGTDVVRLANGSLIHSVADKVSIPRDALAICEELGFDEVIKIAKSLDRDAVEKWPDERLILIGAERKQKEEFSYDLVGMKHGATGT
jgi:phage host-nuclease inhibitor protein Gam